MACPHTCSLRMCSHQGELSLILNMPLHAQLPVAGKLAFILLVSWSNFDSLQLRLWLWSRLALLPPLFVRLRVWILSVPGLRMSDFDGRLTSPQASQRSKDQDPTWITKACWEDVGRLPGLLGRCWLSEGLCRYVAGRHLQPRHVVMKNSCDREKIYRGRRKRSVHKQKGNLYINIRQSKGLLEKYFRNILVCTYFPTKRGELWVDEGRRSWGGLLTRKGLS